ncbi:hypothetical protein M0805_000877 [Coniferiporia weirii]|nr:hypothetical protein M0805_000877 [Coniferiporia weirii]
MSSMPPTPRKAVTAQRQASDKENDSSPRKIEWAESKQVFTFSPDSVRVMNVASSSLGPRKSILKPSRPMRPFPQEKKRDFTPLPDDALSNARFLEFPVSTIIADGSSLRELTEAYSILAARIRASVPQDFWSFKTHDPRYPLFCPLRLHADAVAAAIARDLGRVFVDPLLPLDPSLDSTTEPSKVQKSPLTPRGTPSSKNPKSPKKGGMTEEQVKYARDLSTVSNAAIKFLILAFQVPTIYNVFTKKQLGTLLTAVLAIPLADALRSPSARKICGFAITLLQSQRLPEDVLTTARDRIIYALQRGMDGALGREGKKGAVSEALRAVHDLSLYKPMIFVPGFELYVSSVLENLLTPSCALRVQAAHALGGFVLGITQLGADAEDIIRSVSPRVIEFFLRNEPLPNTQTTIIRTLRTALRSSEPAHHAQGPFWAISVLASFIVLFGPTLLKDRPLLMAFRAILDISVKAKKKVVRMAASTLWGPLIWVWQKWRGSPDVLESEEDGEEAAAECEKVKACFSQMLRLTTRLPIGISFIGTLLGGSHAACQRQDLLMALFELGGSARMGGDATPRALMLLDRLVNSREDSEFYENWSDVFLGKLIPASLLSVAPGLLTAEMSPSVMTPLVEGIISQQPMHEDVRPLSDEERRLPGVWLRVKDAWIACLEQLQFSEGDPVPDVVTEIWMGLIRMGVSSRALEEPAIVAAFAEQCADVLISILTNNAIDLREQGEDPETPTSTPAESESTVVGTSEGKDAVGDAGSAANMRFKLMLVRILWAAAIGVLPAGSRKYAVKPMLRYLVQEHRVLVPSNDTDTDEDKDEALSEWAQFCAQVVALSATNITPALWARNWGWDGRTTARAWRGYARGWAEDSRGSWKGAAAVLGLPFRKVSPWDMSDADLSTWNSLLLYAVEAGANEYVSAPDVLEGVVQCIERQHIISLSSTLRIADHLLSAFEKAIERCTTLPNNLVDLIHEILVTAYPPQPRNKVVAIWLLRSLQMTISNCPRELVIELLEALQDGLSTWIADECALFSKEEYSSEIVPLFQTVLVALELLPPSTEVLQSLSGIIASALQQDSGSDTVADEREEALTSFTEFWSNSCKGLVPPKDGWADGIAQALLLAFPEKPVEVEEVQVAKAQETNALDYDGDELNIFLHTSTPRRRPVSEIPLPPSPSPVRVRLGPGMSLAITPKKPTGAAATRPRRSAAPRLPALFASSPPSPTVLRTARHKATASRQSRLGGASRSSPEKENMPPFSDVDEDEDASLGTKRVLAMADSSPLRAKKRRVQNLSLSEGEDDSEDARAIEEALLRDVPSSSPLRAPLAKSSAGNTIEVSLPLPQTPSKRARGATTATKALVSPSKRRKTRSGEDARKVSRPSLGVVDDDDEEDEEDEWLPSSSDVESEDETSGSSSPVGPFTPRATVHSGRAAIPLNLGVGVGVQNEPASDDSVVTSSSPTRNIRRLARSARLSSGAQKAGPGVERLRLAAPL